MMYFLLLAIHLVSLTLFSLVYNILRERGAYKVYTRRDMEYGQISVNLYVAWSLCLVKIPLNYTVNFDKTGMWGKILAISNLIEKAFLLEGQQHLNTECKLKIGKGHAANQIAQILYKLRHILFTYLRGWGQVINMAKLLPHSWTVSFKTIYMWLVKAFKFAAGPSPFYWTLTNDALKDQVK